MTVRSCMSAWPRLAGVGIRGIALTVAMAAAMAAVTAVAPAAWAQQGPKVFRVGWIGVGNPEKPSLEVQAFRLGMRDLGYVEGRTFVLESRLWSGLGKELGPIVDGMVATKPDIIVAQGPAMTRPGGARRITAVPVVFSVSSDPVSGGLVRSLAQPGGNATGRTLMSMEINGKRLELLREIMPRISRVVLLSNTGHPGNHLEMAENQETANRLGLSLNHIHASSAGEIDSVLARIQDWKAEAIIVLPDALLLQNRQKLIAFAIEARIPLISGWDAFARSGALISYGPNLSVSYRQLALHVDRILKGDKPAALPVERPSVFELVLNLKTARTLDITIPPTVLARADEVIE